MKGGDKMLSAYGYKSKKDLKLAVGKRFNYCENSIHGNQYKPNSMLTVVGPSAYDRKWYAQVWTDNEGIITKVK